MTEKEVESLRLQVLDLPETHKNKLISLLFYQIEKSYRMGFDYEPEIFFKVMQRAVDVDKEVNR